ncbi:MAG: 30S ribosomal protein S12 methylthiotransferase RimO [Chloroflexota bacterium]|nr:MAG: 30S ribosomal protein S12 methylthiotransferase RimO [Chloroflexota bacterium]
MRFYIETLGCPKNAVDSEVLESLLQSHGHQPASASQEADVVLVNTCGFIDAAKEESISTILAFAARKRNGQRLMAFGCLAERFREELVRSIPELDQVLGVGQGQELLRILDRQEGACKETSPVLRRPQQSASAYLKIADGCDARCAFCSIPLIKGPARSREPEEVVSEACYLVAHGVKEIVLVAQDLTAYGLDLGRRDALADLIERVLEAAPELRWLRLMYAYPNRVTPRLIQVMSAYPQVCHYLDLPLQHAHPAVLRRMNRPHDAAGTREVIIALREAMPDIALRSGFIVGYPGESRHEFQTLLDFLEEMELDRVGFFTYSRESGTCAAGLPQQLSARVKRARFSRAMSHQERIARRISARQVGRVLDLLVEGDLRTSPNGRAGEMSHPLVCRSYRDAPEVDGLVFCAGEAHVGDMIRGRVVAAMDHDLLAVQE